MEEGVHHRQEGEQIDNAYGWRLSELVVSTATVESNRRGSSYGKGKNSFETSKHSPDEDPKFFFENYLYSYFLFHLIRRKGKLVKSKR